MLGLSQLDAQTLAQLQMQQNYMQQAAANNQQTNKHLFQNYSFEDQLPTSYYEGGGNVNHRMNLLQQAQSHSFNMDMMSNISNNNNNQIDFLQQQYGVGGRDFERNNPRRNTLKRGQRVIDNSSDELNNLSNLINMSPADLIQLGLTPQQHQQIIMMRTQQYSNNSSGQESGIGSSVYTNSAHGTHDLLANNTSQLHHNIRQQQQQHNLHNISPNSQINRVLVGGGDLMNKPSPSSDNQANNNINNNNVPLASNQISVEFSQTSAPQIPRRKSLPSIVKSKSFKEDETAHSSAELNDKAQQEMFIIENGIRKRVCEKTNSALNQNKMNEQGNLINENDFDPTTGLDKNNKLITDYDDDQTPQLPRKIVLESITNLDMHNSSSNSKRVSMPSIPAYMSPKFASKGTKIKLREHLF